MGLCHPHFSTAAPHFSVFSFSPLRLLTRDGVFRFRVVSRVARTVVPTGSLTGRLLAFACRPYNANEVFVTGNFDDWGKTVRLDRVGDIFSKRVSLPTDKRIHYKACIYSFSLSSLSFLYRPLYHPFLCGEPQQPQAALGAHDAGFSADVTWLVPLPQELLNPLCPRNILTLFNSFFITDLRP